MENFGMSQHWSIIHLGPPLYELRGRSSDGVRMFAVPKTTHSRTVALRHPDQAIVYPSGLEGDLDEVTAVFLSNPDDLETLEVHAQVLENIYQNKDPQNVEHTLQP